MVRKLLLILILSLFTTTANCAITLDSATDDGSNGYTVAHTFSHTVGDYDNTLLIVTASCGNTATGVTFNGVALTVVYVNGYYSQWYLLNPDTGTHDVVISQNAYEKINGNASSYYNVQQQAPEEKDQANATTSSCSLEVTSLTDNAMIIGSCMLQGTGANFASWGTGQTEVTSNDSRQRQSVTNEIKTSLGNDTQTFTLTTTWEWHEIVSVWEEAGSSAHRIPTMLELRNVTIF